MRMHSFQKSLVFEGLTVEGILNDWSRIKPMIVKDWSENIDARFHLFGKVRGSQLWGIDIYTDDFDLVKEAHAAAKGAAQSARVSQSQNQQSLLSSFASSASLL
ncbi:uncharacterized protein LOC127902497 isoform X2 [Citrus sinensis]|nr:uncharacterized protein LOC127902497 isoform X2 [Citrus sinensis]